MVRWSPLRVPLTVTRGKPRLGAGAAQGAAVTGAAAVSRMLEPLAGLDRALPWRSRAAWSAAGAPGRIRIWIASEVDEDDDQVDAINREMYAEVQRIIHEDVSKAEIAMNLLSTSRYMERIADLSTNIAEDVMFMVDGRVFRHVD